MRPRKGRMLIEVSFSPMTENRLSILPSCSFLLNTDTAVTADFALFFFSKSTKKAASRRRLRMSLLARLHSLAEDESCWSSGIQGWHLVMEEIVPNMSKSFLTDSRHPG